jgi:hypothetical protein
MRLVSVFLSTTSNLSVFPAKGQNRILAEILKCCNSMVNSEDCEFGISRAKMAKIYVATHCCSRLLLLRCQAQLELFYFLAGLVTVLRFGARNGSYYCFFGGLVVVVKEVPLQARSLYLQLLEMS